MKEGSAISDTPGGIAVIGMAGRFPLAPDIASFWRRLYDLDDCVTASLAHPPHLGPDQWLRNGGVGTPAGYLAGFNEFDAGFFGISPREASITDPQHRLLLEVAWEALEDAGYGEPTGLRVGVFATASQSGYLWTNVRANAAAVAATDETQLTLATAPDFLATRLSYKLDLRGPSLTVAAACASSMVALHLARQSLLAGECDFAVVGAASVTASPWCAREPDGTPTPPTRTERCRSFSTDADYSVSADGVAVVVLRRFGDAVAARDNVRAVLRATAVNNDGGHKMAFSAPSVDGQAQVVRDALDAAGVAAASVDYVEGHGSGTPIGDSIELAALAEAYGTRPDGPRLLGSVKSNIGYLDGTAGLAGLVKTVLALQHATIPGNLHFTAAHPNTEGFEVVTAPTAWPRTDTPRRAGVASFAMGGTNTHAILEEAPAASAGGSGSGRAHAVLTVSGRTAEAADAAVERLIARLADGDAELSDAAYTLHVGRRAHPYRRAVVVSGGADVAAADWSPAVEAPRSAPAVVLHLASAPPSRSAAAALYAQEPAFRSAVDECAAVLSHCHGITVALGDDADGSGPAGPDGQPVLMAFLTWYGLARLWRQWGVTPAAVVGPERPERGSPPAPPGGRGRSRSLAEASTPPVPPHSTQLRTARAALAASAGLNQLTEILAAVVSGAVTEPGPAQPPVEPTVPVELASCLDGRGLAEALARLWTHGVAIDWVGYHAFERPRRVALPTYPFARTPYWIDPDQVSTTQQPAPVAEASTAVGEAWDEVLDRMLAEGIDPVTAAVANVWQDVLGVSSVADDDDFFALGGDSLRLLRVIGRLREMFDLEISLSDAFGARRLDQLVALLEDLVTREAAG